MLELARSGKLTPRDSAAMVGELLNVFSRAYFRQKYRVRPSDVEAPFVFWQPDAANRVFMPAVLQGRKGTRTLCADRVIFGPCKLAITVRCQREQNYVEFGAVK